MTAEVGECTTMRDVPRLGVAETIVHSWLPRLIKSLNTTYLNLLHEIGSLARSHIQARRLTPSPHRAIEEPCFVEHDRFQDRCPLFCRHAPKQ